ncbi:leucine-rich repeat-containing protein 14-like [Sorex araneus]|uniref:leucine-rich repeat-containing protein 14-like n=1 Tax=Sorex araneus TaxID=42254 RepID=UPI002433ECDF|nr:leucine-rich repeat-containing protein 14-like [Sorex araneus]
MNRNTAPTLWELAEKCLLSDVPAAIQALEVLPKHLFIPLFKTAFLGRQKEMLKAMVKVWPFHCLHIGTLKIQERPYEIMEALVDGLQFIPVENSPPRGPKLRILDLRQNIECRITCSYRTKCAVCFHSCVYSERSILEVEEALNEVQCRDVVPSESDPGSVWKTAELLINLSFNSTLTTKRFLSFLKSKVEQSSGSLHLCCRYLQINQTSVHTNMLQILDPACIDRLEVNRVHLRRVTTLFPQLKHLDSLKLTSIPYQSCSGPNFEIFLIWLEKLDILQELNLSFFCLSNRVHRLLSVLQSPIHLTSLSLPFCDLSNRDITVLSQCSQVTHLKRLNLSNNLIFWGGREPFQILLERVSDTLQHLEINNCQVTDSALEIIIPALTRCSHLRVILMALNPVTMSALENLLQSLTPMVNLKSVVYPIPAHCYEDGSFPGSLNRQKLGAVKVRLNILLQMARRSDMSWTTYPE